MLRFLSLLAKKIGVIRRVLTQYPDLINKGVFMCPKKRIDFGGEISRMQPVILREVSKKHVFTIIKAGLTFPQITILDFVKEKGECKMGDLADALNMTMSAVTGIVDKMIKLKLVKRRRSQKDRRIVRVAFLKKGRDMVSLMNKERREAINNLFSAFTDAEKMEYLRLVRKMYNDIRKEK